MILQHGTIILDVDVKKMFSLLKVPDEKIRDKMITAAEERVTSVSKELGTTKGFEEVRLALVSAFMLGTTKEGKLSQPELDKAKELLKQKYSTREWNFMR
jgi:lipoate-protein ligase A